MQDFSKLYADYFSDVYNFSMKLTGYQRDIAEELAQETFYRAFTSFAKFKGECHIKTWLIQIAKNTFYTYLRNKRKAGAVLVSMTAGPNEGNNIPFSQESLENKEFINHILVIISSFDEKMRDVMLYRFFSELPYSQISAIMEISEGSAKTICCRGKIELQNRLREVYGYEI